MSKSISSPPSFLTPSVSDLNQIYRTLSNREQARHILSQRSLQFNRSNTSNSNHARDEPFAVNVGSSRDNIGNNRYGDIIAYDSSRILIPSTSTSTSTSTSEPVPSEFYVNASLILAPDLGFSSQDLPRRYWVAAQGPTSTTTPSFLSLLLHPPRSPSHPDPQLSPINLIIQLTPLIEQNREKCAPYFPSDREGEEWVWDEEDREDGGSGSVWVRYEGRLEGEKGERRSKLRVGSKEGLEEGREVVHVEYLGWRDHGVPEDPSHLVSFISRMNLLNSSLSPSPSPILIHCSAGVGRTGTYLSISSLLPLLKLYASNSSLPSPSTSTTREDNHEHPIEESYPHKGDYVGMTVDRIRDQRTTMVQTRDQLGFVYQALRTAWEEGTY